MLDEGARVASTAEDFCIDVARDLRRRAGFNALMDELEMRVFQEWRAGAFDDWAMAWGELDAIKRLRFAVITKGEVSNGKRESDNPRGRRRAAAATATTGAGGGSGAGGNG